MKTKEEGTKTHLGHSRPSSNDSRAEDSEGTESHWNGLGVVPSPLSIVVLEVALEEREKRREAKVVSSTFDNTR